MADILYAISVSGAILLLVVGGIIVLSIAAVKRGEVAMHGDPNVKAWWNTGLSAPGAGGAAAAAAKAPPAEVSVLGILLVGTGIFVLAVLFLFAVSVLGHL